MQCVNAVCRAVCNVEPSRRRRRCTLYQSWESECVSSLIKILCWGFLLLRLPSVFEVCYLTASVFFALCKYVLVKVSWLMWTKRKQNKKNGSMKYFFSACSSSFYGYLRPSLSDCTSLATLLEAVSHNPVIALNLYELMINIIKMLFM